MGQEVGAVAVPLQFGFLATFPTFVLETLLWLGSITGIREMIRYGWLPPSGHSWPIVIVALLFFGAVGFGYVRSLVKRKIPKAFWYFLLFVVFLMPVAYIHAQVYASPRMYYVPLFALGGLLALVTDRLSDRSGAVARATRFGAIALVILLGLGSFLRCFDYRSPMAFWKAETENNPENAYGFHYYGYNLMRQGRFSEALPVVETAQRLAPEALEVQNNLGLCNLNLGENAKAEALFRGILRSRPDPCKSYYHLALLDRRRGRPGNALELLDQALRRCPSYAHAISLREELKSALQSKRAIPYTSRPKQKVEP